MSTRLAASSESPSPTPVAAGSSSSLGERDVRREEREPHRDRREVRDEHRWTGRDSEVDERVGDAQLVPAPDQRAPSGRRGRTRGVAGEVQPHALPCATARSTPDRPIDSPTTPGTSKRPGVRSVLTGTTRAMSANSTTPSAADVQKSRCQSRALGDQCARGKAERAAESQRRAHECDRPANAILVQVVTQDRDAERDDAR